MDTRKSCITLRALNLGNLLYYGILRSCSIFGINRTRPKSCMQPPHTWQVITTTPDVCHYTEMKSGLHNLVVNQNRREPNGEHKQPTKGIPQKTTVFLGRLLAFHLSFSGKYLPRTSKPMHLPVSSQPSKQALNSFPVNTDSPT